MSRFLWSSAVAVLWLGSASPLAAQYRWDEVNKTYWVSVRDDSGILREMRVEPANRVIPVLQLVQIDTGGRVEFRYRVGADSSSPQGLALVRIPCALTSGTVDHAGGDWRNLATWGSQRFCSYSVPLARGAPPRLVRFSSPQLAGLGSGVAEGSRSPPEWPTSDPDEQSELLGPLVDSLSGDSPNGLVKRFAMPVPKYDRMIVAQTDSGLRIIASELARICAETDWIPTDATCDALSALLPTTTAAIRAAPAPSAAAHTPAELQAIRQALNRFMQALVAGRDTTIHQNAFTILHVLARVVQQPLIPVGP